MQKHLIKSATLCMALLLLTAGKVLVQVKPAVDSTVYWVLVSNLHIRHACTVQYHNSNNQLIYQENINRKINPKRLKTLRCLKRGLDSALLAWRDNRQALYNKSWVADIFKSNR